MESGTSKPCNQKRMGPAPFASFEDLSDEMDSPGEKEVSVIRLPGITEQDVTSTSPATESKTNHHPGVSLIGFTLKSSYPSSSNSLTHSPVPNKMKLANTPRIDISRASSSSHHDSRDSTPEREIFESTDANTMKVGLGFKEDDALDLRLSTEELDFQDTDETKTHKYKYRSASPQFDELYTNNNRKDSQCSDVILLSISGRTSRLSSIGSQGSAQSRLSNASHISVTSGQSAYSQCSSPHKTLLETSFCGYRGSQSSIAMENTGLKGDSDDFEKVLLSRKPNPEVVLIEGLGHHKMPIKYFEETNSSKHKISNTELKQESKEDTKGEGPRIPKKIISKSGVEYIYIPLKGPLPTDDSEEKECIMKTSRTEHGSGRHKQTADKSSHRDLGQKSQVSSGNFNRIHHQQNQEPKYIRIKLKPDHCYDIDDRDRPSTSNVTKPASLSLPLKKQNGTTIKVEPDNSFSSIHKHARSLTNSPKLLRKEMDGSTSSPSVARRNSFATLLRTGPDSPSTSKQKRKNTLTGCINYSISNGKNATKTSDYSKSPSACVSSTESVDSKGKHKSVLSLFKFPKDKPKTVDLPPEKTHKRRTTDSKTRVHKEERRELPLNSESVRIPLHSPTYYENKSILQELQTSSQDSQITVVEVLPQTKSSATVIPISEECNAKIESTKCDIEFDSRDVTEKVELLDARLQVEDDGGGELSKKLVKSPSSLPSSSMENNTTITITADVESAKIYKEMSCQNMKETKLKSLSTSGSLGENSKISESQSNCGSHAFDDHNSSESERDIELEYRKCDKPLLPGSECLEIERKAIVLQQDSFEDDLPYVPTTLPQERSAAIPILPIKQRCVLDMKTCPIERPRSTTPINSSGIETYFDGFTIKSDAVNSEKLKISLPRSELSTKPKNQGEVTVSSSIDYKETKDETPPPPPLPPKGIQKSWINFEEVPERRKPPKRIQTIPSRGQIDITGLVKDNIVYTYVNPEECKCECHEHKEPENVTVTPPTLEDEVPLLTQDEKVANSNR